MNGSKTRPTPARVSKALWARRPRVEPAASSLLTATLRDVPGLRGPYGCISPGTSCGPLSDPVGDRADPVDLQLHRLSGAQPAVVLEAAAAGHRPGRDHVARPEPLARGGVGDHRADLVRLSLIHIS